MRTEFPHELRHLYVFSQDPNEQQKQSEDPVDTYLNERVRARSSNVRGTGRRSKDSVEKEVASPGEGDDFEGSDPEDSWVSPPTSPKEAWY
jgi:hypothetical protein